MLTTRLGSAGRNNSALGLDAVVRWLGHEYVILQWARTFDEATEQEGGLESGLLRGRLERRRDDGFSYYAEAIRVGADYLPGLGFQSRRGFSNGGAQLRYRQLSDPTSPLVSRALQVATTHYFRNEDGSAESREIRPEIELDFRQGSNLTFGALSSFESVREPFPISDVVVPAAEYWFHEATFMFRMPRSSQFRGEYNGSAGTFYDGTRLSLALNPAWVLSKYLEIEAGYEVNRLDFADRDASTTTQLARLKVNTALNPSISLSTFGQYNSAIGQTTFNVRFRYHFREGTDLWIVYNEGLHNERDNGLGPRAPALIRPRGDGQVLPHVRGLTECDRPRQQAPTPTSRPVARHPRPVACGHSHGRPRLPAGPRLPTGLGLPTGPACRPAPPAAGPAPACRWPSACRPAPRLATGPPPLGTPQRCLGTPCRVFYRSGKFWQFFYRSGILLSDNVATWY